MMPEKKKEEEEKKEKLKAPYDGVPVMPKRTARIGQRVVVGTYATYEEARKAVEATKAEVPRKFFMPRIRIRGDKYIVTAMKLME